MNLPNKITVSRLVMTMVFIGLAAIPRSVENYLLYWRIGYVVAVIAGITDFLDGYLARKLDQVTDFGKLMDPLTDKIFTVGCFIVFTGYGLVPSWITVLILTREFTVTGLRSLAASKGEVIAAKDIGKVKTVLQMLVLAFGGCFWVDWISMEGVTYIWVWPFILGSMTLLTVYSGWDYLWRSRHLYLKDT